MHPVGEHIDSKLNGENGCEDQVYEYNKIIESLGVQLFVLSIHYADGKVLSNGASAVYSGIETHSEFLTEIIKSATNL